VKWHWRLVWIGLLGFVAVLFGNALRHFPKPRARAQPVDASIDAQRIARHLAEAIRFPTISHQDAKDDDRQLYAQLRAWLATTYPRVHATFQHELINGDALLYHWEGSDPGALPILLMAHQDVVPVEPGTESQWTHPAFDGVIAEGFVWGRGALDDKGSLVTLFEAFEALIAEGFRPTRGVYFVSGFDEEVGGVEGAKRVAAELAQRHVHFLWVLDEGGAVTQGVVPDVARPVAGVAVAEKGYITVELIAHADGGHSSMPPHITAVGELSRAIVRLEQTQMEPRMTETMRQMLETVAPEQPWPQRLVLSNLWLSEPLVTRALAERYETSPSVRSTTAPTMLQAGIKENVLPSSARAVVNFRILPGDSIAKVIEHVTRAIDEPRISVHALDRTVSEPSPLSSTTGPGFALLRAELQALYPDAVLVPAVMNGKTDAKHLQPLADAVYYFVPRMLVKEDLKRMHGTNERAGVKDLARSVQFYRELVRHGAGPASR
jgi:carboxypeptidase PM20D1